MRSLCRFEANPAVALHSYVTLHRRYAWSVLCKVTECSRPNVSACPHSFSKLAHIYVSFVSILPPCSACSRCLPVVRARVLVSCLAVARAHMLDRRPSYSRLFFTCQQVFFLSMNRVLRLLTTIPFAPGSRDPRHDSRDTIYYALLNPFYFTN